MLSIPAGILSIIAFYHFSVYLLQSGGYLADFAVGYLAAVYLSDRRNMGGGAGQEALCGAVKLHPIDMPFDCFNAQLGFSQLHRLLAGNAHQKVMQLAEAELGIK